MTSPSNDDVEVFAVVVPTDLPVVLKVNPAPLVFPVVADNSPTPLIPLIVVVVPTVRVAADVEVTTLAVSAES